MDGWVVDLSIERWINRLVGGWVGVCLIDRCWMDG